MSEIQKFKLNMPGGLKHLCLLVLLVPLFSFGLYADSPCDKGLATLSISVSAMNEPCKVDTTEDWFIMIFNCDGTFLEFCGKRYILIPAVCGCLDIEVPPGCYYIKAVWSYGEEKPGVYWVNHFTDAAIAQACCGKTTCVRLFNPSVHRCGYVYALAVNDLVHQNAIGENVGLQVKEAIEAVNKEIPVPENKFEMGIEREIDEYFEKGEVNHEKTEYRHHKLRFSFHVGATYPLSMGSLPEEDPGLIFDNNLNGLADSNVHFRFNLDYPLSDNLDLVGIMGFSQFTDDYLTDTHTHYYTFNISANLKWLFPSGSGLKWYLQAGPGLYIPKPNLTLPYPTSNTVGFNVGFGSQIPLNGPFNIEWGIDMHNNNFTKSEEPKYWFLTLQLGVLFK